MECSSLTVTWMLWDDEVNRRYRHHRIFNCLGNIHRQVRYFVLRPCSMLPRRYDEYMCTILPDFFAFAFFVRTAARILDMFKKKTLHWYRATFQKQIGTLWLRSPLSTFNNSQIMHLARYRLQLIQPGTYSLNHAFHQIQRVWLHC